MASGMRKSMNWKYRVFFFVAAAVAASSCDSSTGVIANDTIQTANNDQVMESLTDEVDELATTVLTSFSMSGSATGGRLETIRTDDRFCDVLNNTTFENVSGDSSSGRVTVVFPSSGCTDRKGNVRTGTMIIDWTGGKWYKQGSQHVITLSNYRVNDISITGTRTLKTDTFAYISPKLFAAQWSVEAFHTMTWPDQSTATFSVNKTRRWDHNATDDTFTHTNGPYSSATFYGTNRHGKNFSVKILTSLFFARSCVTISKNFMPLAGTKTLTDLDAGKDLQFDYGAGACDNSYILRADGTSQTLHAKNDSSDD
jgi:hypothetical protein